MRAKQIARLAAEVVLLLAWAVFAFWLFSLSYSSSFFRYNLPSRLPPFVAAVAGAVALPISAVYQWRRARRRAVSPLKAWILHGLCAAAAVLPLMLVAAIQSRAPNPWHASADDAMGTGIDFLLLAAGAILSSLVLGVALLAGRSAPRAGSRLGPDG